MAMGGWACKAGRIGSVKNRVHLPAQQKKGAPACMLVFYTMLGGVQILGHVQTKPEGLNERHQGELMEARHGWRWFNPVGERR